MLAGTMLVAYIIVLAVPEFRDLAELVLLGLFDYALLAIIDVIWGLALRTVWRRRMLGWFLGVDLE